MAVLIETSHGEFVMDLNTEECPIASKNFLKLCKIKYYHNSLFFKIEKNFVARTGDPIQQNGTGGCSIFGLVQQPSCQKDDKHDSKRFFSCEHSSKLKHNQIGRVGMSPYQDRRHSNTSTFYITLSDHLEYLDSKGFTVFAEITEGLEIIKTLNQALIDEYSQPLQNIRIRKTIILHDPFEDPDGIEHLIPECSPQYDEEEALQHFERFEDEVEVLERVAEKEATSRAVTLEILGDLPDADFEPPNNVLFICKLNPVTKDSDLHTVFSRFGAIKSCDVIQDWKTGDSLQYGFIEFEKNDSCENAYFKMQDCLIDDRRIHVDFCQSVSKLWKQYKVLGKEQAAEADHIMFNAANKRLQKQQDKVMSQQVQPMSDAYKNRRQSRSAADYTFILDRNSVNRSEESQKTYEKRQFQGGSRRPHGRRSRSNDRRKPTRTHDLHESEKATYSPNYHRNDKKNTRKNKRTSRSRSLDVHEQKHRHSGKSHSHRFR